MRKIVERRCAMSLLHAHLRHLQVGIGVMRIDSQNRAKTLLRLFQIIDCKVVIPEIVQNRSRARSDLEGTDVKLFCLGIAPLRVEDYGNQTQGLEILRMRLQDGPESILSISSAPILKILDGFFVNGIGLCGSLADGDTA